MTTEHPALEWGDKLAHELRLCEHPTLVGGWWKARGGHDKCTVCSPRNETSELADLKADAQRWRWVRDNHAILALNGASDLIEKTHPIGDGYAVAHVDHEIRSEKIWRRVETETTAFAQLANATHRVCLWESPAAALSFRKGQRLMNGDIGPEVYLGDFSTLGRAQAACDADLKKTQSPPEEPFPHG
jgi:hypothetical protein